MIATENKLQLVLMQHCHEKFNSGVFMPNFHFMWHEADLIYITKTGYSTEFEIKISKADFKKDAEKRCNSLSKSEYLKSGKAANYFYYVAPKNLLSVPDIPDYAGFIEIDLANYSQPIYYIKLAPKLHKNKTERIRSQIYEKAYHRYTDKILVPSLRKLRKEMYEEKYGADNEGL